MLKSQIHSTPTLGKRQPQFRTLDDLLNGACPHCGGPVGVDYAHVGGYSQNQPVAVCETPDSDHYYLGRISQQLADDYADFLQGMADANELWAATLDERVYSTWTELEAEEAGA